MQSENGILIKTWYDDLEDNALEELSKLLLHIASEMVEDVRVPLRSLRQ